MTSPQSPNPRSGRTKMITAASIGAVALASLFAIGANLGILARADQRTIGTMSAAIPPAPADTGVLDVGLTQQTDPLASTSATLDGAQHFTVDTAGAVDVSVGASGLQLDLVSPSPGWTATPVAATDADVAVTFTNGIRTLEFSATVGPDGTAIGDLTEAAPAPAPSSSSSSDHHDTADGHHDDHHSDHDHDGSDDDD